MWYDRKKRFIEGVKLISTKLSNVELTETLKKYYNSDDSEEFTLIEFKDLTKEESLLISKTLFYIVQRLKLFLLSPVKLQNDLADLGFTEQQSECIVKLYSESSRHITNNIRTQEFSENDTSITWEVKTSLNEANLRNKTPVARLSLKADNQEIVLEDMNHSELATLFDKFETIQKELDILSAKTTEKN